MAGALTVAVAGLGAIGTQVARALDRGIDGLRLTRIAARDTERARNLTAGFATPPEIVALEKLAEADIVVEATPPDIFDEVAGPAIAAGRLFIPCSAGALLSRMHLVDEARRSGARIVVPSGAIAGLDAIRAAAEGTVASVSIETRKPPGGLAGAPYLALKGIDVLASTDAMLVFEGNALEAARAFPSNINVAAALSLAGIGPEHTMVRIWSDPEISRNTHTIYVESAATRLTVTVENMPSDTNPKTSKLSGFSVIACLRGLSSSLRVGS